MSDDAAAQLAEAFGALSEPEEIKAFQPQAVAAAMQQAGAKKPGLLAPAARQFSPYALMTRAQQKPKTFFRRDEAKVKRPRSPSADAVLARLVQEGKIDQDTAVRVLQTTPRGKSGNYFKRIAKTPEFDQLQERALGTRLMDRNALVGNFQNLAGPGRLANKEANERVKAIRDPKKRRNATKEDLYGGDPLNQLLSGQRGYLSKKILNQVAVHPHVAVQLFARQPGGIASATRCAAAVEAARLASRATYGSSTAKYTGGPAEINMLKKKRASGRDMSKEQRSSIYRGLAKLDQTSPTKSRKPRTQTFIEKLVSYGVSDKDIRDIINSEPKPREERKERQRTVQPEFQYLEPNEWDLKRQQAVLVARQMREQGASQEDIDAAVEQILGQ